MSKLITSSSHGPGNTCLTFSKDGSRAYTGGQDCIVRIWKINEGAEQEPETATEAEQAVTTVAATDDCWLSGSEDAEVRRYAKDRSELLGLVTSAVGVGVRCVAIDPKGKRVAVASDELFVKVVDLEDMIGVSQLKGHTAGVRRVTWHPSAPLLTSSGADGKVIAWDVSTEEARIESTLEGIIPAVSDAESPEFAHDCSVVWDPSGLHFYVSTRAHEIVVVSRANWSRIGTFSDKDVSGAITALALSPNGTYLASASRSKVHVWATNSRRVVASHAGTPGSTITQLAFSPKDNLIAWTDTNGVFSRWQNAISDSFPDPVKPAASATASATANTGPSLFIDDSTDVATGLGDNLDEVDLDTAFPEVDDDWIIDDVGGGLHDEPETSKSRDGFVKEMVSITKAQLPFQPASTPLENRKRYLAYNMLGVIEVTDQDTHHIINVEFFDRSARKGYHFTDRFKYELGYLGERGAVFACQPEGEHQAHVLYKPYGTWTTQAEWTYTLTEKDIRVLGVAAGGVPPSKSLRNSADSDLQGFGNVVVATSEGDLTFLSGSGRERRIMGIGADFVSMVAGPEWVFVIHRAGSTTIDGSQNLSYTMINFEDFSVRQRDVLPVPKGHTLKWIGLTDQGAPAMYDSTGRVHILTKFRIPHHASWARVMDTNLLERRVGKDESYWAVGITDSTFMCLILKGRQEHPGFPRPLIQELPIRLPFRGKGAREEQIERELLLIQIAFDGLDDELTTDDILMRERAMDKEFIVLIQAACKADNIPRAIELVKLLHQLTSFDAAMKIADFYHLVGFREKVEILKADRENQEDRLVLARNKRKRWLKPDPPIREVQSLNNLSSTRTDLLGDVRPPPTIERPGMARVTVPIIEQTRFSSKAPPLVLPSQREETPFVEPPPPSEGKRKRVEADDFEDPSSSFPMAPPPPKQRTNPFARKPGQEASRNPFARKSELNKTVQKSESFFDKVDGVKGGGEPLKSKGPSTKSSKDKKDAPRQSTLNGQMSLDKMLSGKGSDKDKKNRSTNKVTRDSPPQENGTQDSQITDVDMSDMNTLVETQESELSGAGGWEETQLAESETQDLLEETQLVE
ncbi:hypothetical protein BDZ94DRAFT_1322712 [Collybia nuda]|uniref:Minichromosome loss protein Mcl1 middle region domain-containing protein n=1 Tax=Collybia nuda TaxID=64659 RepID=A0A9P6CHI8_9AGAR|nr:hypothetical protein BDZ94DRAFT_1322712 [Collybia nuda]